MLIIHENTLEIYKHFVQVDLDDWDVAKKNQVHLWQKIWQNLTDTDTCENIYVYIYHGHYKFFSKWPAIMTIHDQPL